MSKEGHHVTFASYEPVKADQFRSVTFTHCTALVWYITQDY